MPDWQEILDRDGQAAWRTAYRILGDRDDADECLQEAFLGALEVSRREDVRRWRALLQRLATARAMDRLRRRHRREARPGTTDWDQLPCPAPIPPQSAEDAELSERLRAALAQLPSKQSRTSAQKTQDDHVLPWNTAGDRYRYHPQTLKLVARFPGYFGR
jgi:RNA polymerase sigma factor (sigma-70 family)